MNEIQLRKLMISQKLSIIDESITDGEKASNMLRVLYIIIPPKSISDRTTMRNIVKYYAELAKNKGEQPDAIFKVLIDFALEASGPFSRVPAAVFISILKKELSYPGAIKSAE